MLLRRAARGFLLLGLLLASGWQSAAAIQLSLPQPAGPAMWRLQAEDATVYFLGSFHLLPPSLVWRDERVAEAMREARTVVFEVDMPDSQEGAVNAMMMRRAALPAGRTLQDELDVETYAHLTRVVARTPLQMPVLERTKPWFVATALVVGYMMQQGADPALGVDAVLAREARASGKTIAAFETIEQQLDLLESMSREEPNFLVMDTIRFIENPEGLLARTIDAWKSGDTDTLARVMEDDLDGYEGAYDRFIADRNAAWVPEIEAMIRKGGVYFVVVGAGHLVGDRNVIGLLEAKGYQIERF